MFATLLYDAMAGLGCAAFTLLVMAGAALCLALRLGYLPGLTDRLRKKEDGGEIPPEPRE